MSSSLITTLQQLVNDVPNGTRPIPPSKSFATTIPDQRVEVPFLFRRLLPRRREWAYGASICGIDVDECARLADLVAGDGNVALGMAAVRARNSTPLDIGDSPICRCSRDPAG